MAEQLDHFVRMLEAVCAERDRLRTALESLRLPIKCSIFGVPEDEVIRLLGVIDNAIAGTPAGAEDPRLQKTKQELERLRDAAERVVCLAKPIKVREGEEEVVTGYVHEKTGAMHTLIGVLRGAQVPT